MDLFLKNKIWLVLALIVLVIGMWAFRCFWVDIQLDKQANLKDVNGTVEVVKDASDDIFIELKEKENVIFHLNKNICYSGCETIEVGKSISMQVHFVDEDMEYGEVYSLSSEGREILSIESSREFEEEGKYWPIFAGILCCVTFIVMIIIAIRYGNR